MASNSNIEWTDATWNPLAGCSMVSPGCAHCYAETMAKRLRGMARKEVKAGIDPGRKRAYLNVLNDKGKWNGKIELIEEALTEPLHWKKPRRVFVNSMSDLFHEDVPFDFVDKVFAVMALCPQHTFQILTKRPERMAVYLTTDGVAGRISAAPWSMRLPYHLASRYRVAEPPDPEMVRLANVATAAVDPDGSRAEKIRASRRQKWPLSNVWLGTSVENQKLADERIPHLHKCPAAIRFLSVEPMLAAIDLADGGHGHLFVDELASGKRTRIHWVIVGGESGPGARPMHPEWVTSLRDQCVAAGVPFFFKQWGAFRTTTLEEAEADDDRIVTVKESPDHDDSEKWPMTRVGKKLAGRLLDAREWNEMPEVAR